MKRIASIQDFSCLGRCSQTVALPILSAMGFECAALPTALLSAHTAVDGFVRYDLTDRLAPMIDHWARLGLRFDAIYTGYLASVEQVDLVAAFFDRFPAPLRFVDPVMGDCGRLYHGSPPTLPSAMRRLCRMADVISPNVTEACLLTDTPYRAEQDEPYVRALSDRLAELGAGASVITGLCLRGGTTGVAVRDADGFFLHTTASLPGMFHGAGDLFAATAVGALVGGLPLREAAALAADHVAYTLRLTLCDPKRRSYGINFESAIPHLMQQLHLLPQSEVTL